MRIPVLLSIAVFAAAACASEKIETASTFVPERDLTLQTKLALPQAEITSAEELERPRAKQIPPRARSKPQPRPRSTAAPALLTVVEPVAALRLTVVQPLAQPIPAAVDAPVSDRELPPGKTVTVIPASSGPSVAPEPGDDAPPALGRPLVRGGGGTCHGRGER
jgi:hypothetical protein